MIWSDSFKETGVSSEPETLLFAFHQIYLRL